MSDKLKRGDLVVLRDNHNYQPWAEVGDIFVVLGVQEGRARANDVARVSRLPGPLNGHDVTYCMYAHRFEKVGEVSDAER